MDNKITTICPHCKRKMKVKEIYLGKKIKCPKCKDVFKIELYDSEFEPGLKTEFIESADYDKVMKEQGSTSGVKEQAVEDKLDEFPNGGEEQTEQPSFPSPFDGFGLDETEQPQTPATITDEQYNCEKEMKKEIYIETYSEPKMKVFNEMLPENPEIVEEFNLGVSGLIIPESTKVLVTKNEVYINNSRRYLFGIFPGGKKIASYPIGFPQLRAGMLRIKSLFAMLILFVFSAAISLGLWFLLKGYVETLPQTFEALIPAIQTAEFYQNFWYLCIPIDIAVIWILLFWRCIYKTQLFKVSFSRWSKKNAQNCIRKINEISHLKDHNNFCA